MRGGNDEKEEEEEEQEEGKQVSIVSDKKTIWIGMNRPYTQEGEEGGEVAKIDEDGEKQEPRGS